MADFKALDLYPSILKTIEKKGYRYPTPIQERTIPSLMLGRDLLGIAQTGTGKTASFSLPIIDRLAKNPVALEKRSTRALILAPTRELATQIHKNISAYSEGLDLTSAVIIGGVRKERQIDDMEPGKDIIIATPGRLLDLMNGGNITLNQLEVFVLDEADMMLDMGFFSDVQVVKEKMPTSRQTILFSATMPKEIEALSDSLLTDPVKVETAPESTPTEKVKQYMYYVEEDNKLFLLNSLLEDSSLERVLIFCKAKYGVANVVESLEKSDINCGEIHSNRTQSQRDEAIELFTKGEVRVLVATDIASRGLDIDDVTHVINFNLPEDPTFYVHRIGRTARADREGVAISLCGDRDLVLLRNINKVVRPEFTTISDHAFHVDFPEPTQKKIDKVQRAIKRKRPSQAKRKSKRKFINHLKNDK